MPGLGRVFACADDIGAAISALHHLLPLARLFNLLRKVTGLTVKPSKCVMILTSITCTEQNIGHIRNRLHNNIPEWENMAVNSFGKYLGFCSWPFGWSPQLARPHCSFSPKSPGDPCCWFPCSCVSY